MPLMICPKCKKFHYVPGECPTPKIAAVEEKLSRQPHKLEIAGASPAPATKSTAAQKGVHADGVRTRKDRLVRDQGRKPNSEAGTQAPPVDTPLTKRGTPRQRAPKGSFDRKAYQRVKAKERRAAKAAKEPK